MRLVVNPLVERIIEDARTGQSEWWCGPHSDLWTGEHPKYKITETTSGWLNWYFVMQVGPIQHPVCFTRRNYKRLMKAINDCKTGRYRDSEILDELNHD